MKELSIEEKAKRYDIALDKIKMFLGTGSSCSREELKYVFPELAESEDEMFRKYILKCCEETISADDRGLELSMNTTIKLKNWLEKQGEKELVTCPICGWEIEKQADHAKFINSIQVGDRVTRNQDGILVNLSQLERIAKSNESKQSKQKFVDKIEPKFKVGDWVIFNENHNSVYQVERIDNYRYYLRHYLGGSLSVHFDNELIRKWTIQDAKDGDVLYSLDSLQPFIYKERKSHEQATAYCGINKYGKFFVWNDKYCIIALDKYVPANKEQRDFLFKKMKEAGYEWNKDNKELKKVDEIEEPDFFDDFRNSDVEVDSNEDGLIAATIKYKNEQKPAWSEEDERIVQNLLSLWKEVMIEPTCCRFGLHKDEVVDFLKSLKDRYAWKPSDEQMKALGVATNIINVPEKEYIELEKLYQDLEKLREE